MSDQPEPSSQHDPLQSAETSASLATSAARASMWVAVSAIATQLVLLINSVVMARILTPAEFGIVEICITIALFVNLIGENGFSAEIVQHREISRVYLATAFWTNLGIGALLTGVGLCAVWIATAWLKDTDTALLLALTMLNFVVSGFGTVQRVLLVRALRFSIITSIELTGILVFTVLSTALALRGFGGVSYIVGWLARTVLVSILLFASGKWRPDFAFNVGDFKRMMSFGASIVAGRALVYANSSIDRFVVLSTLGTEQLGYYTLARRMPTAIATLLYSVILRVMYPVMARVQADPQRMKRIYLKTVEMLALLVALPMTLLVVVAQPFVVALFGEQWEPAVLATRLMALTPLFVLIVQPCDSAFQAIGRPDLVWKNYALRMLLYVPFLLIGVRYGLNGAAIAVLAYTVVSAIITQAIVKHVLKIDWLSILSAAWPPLRNSLAAGLVAAGVLFFCKSAEWSELPTLLLTSAVGASVYLVMFRLLNADDLAEIIQLAAQATNQPWFERKLKDLLQM